MCILRCPWFITGQLFHSDHDLLLQLENVALGVQEQHEGKERDLEGGAAQGRASGGRIPTQLVNIEHGHAEVHPERRNAQIRRLCCNHPQPQHRFW